MTPPAVERGQQQNHARHQKYMHEVANGVNAQYAEQPEYQYTDRSYQQHRPLRRTRGRIGLLIRERCKAPPRRARRRQLASYCW
jgi:hypothetical protein